jgi:hypothetical protein
VIDPLPGPRRLDEIENADPVNEAVVLARPETRGPGGFAFAEARMAEVLGEPTVLVDPNGGPAVVAAAIADAAPRLGCDVVAFIDVGGDALAHGDESGLASPLCDALMLAAAARLAGDAGGAPAVLGGVFGIGCDGELTVPEVLERLGEVAAAGGLAGSRGLTAPVVERLDAAVEAVPTEASAQAIRCFRGELGTVSIRRGLRTVELSPLAAATVYFDVRAAVGSAARLASAIGDAADLEHANRALNELGVHTELDLERGL